MRIRLATAVVLLACAPSALGAHHTSTPKAPTSRQIRADVRSAERSRRLWATVNICNSTRYPEVIGIRGQLPGLPFASRVSMTIGVDYADSAHPGTFTPLPGVAERISGGVQTSGTWQAGVRLRFKAGTGLLRGRITMQWTRGGHAIGQLAVVSSAGHTDARYSDPSGFSAASCTLP